MPFFFLMCAFQFVSNWNVLGWLLLSFLSMPGPTPSYDHVFLPHGCRTTVHQHEPAIYYLLTDTHIYISHMCYISLDTYPFVGIPILPATQPGFANLLLFDLVLRTFLVCTYPYCTYVRLENTVAGHLLCWLLAMILLCCVEFA